MDSPRTWNFVDNGGNAWHCHSGPDHVVINAVDAEGRVTDRVRLERVGIALMGNEVTTPPLGDALTELKVVESLLRTHFWRSRLRNGEQTAPYLVHSTTAARVWPVFGRGEFPTSGACNVQGATLTWSIELDRYVQPL